jgi:hypothetical protein
MAKWLARFLHWIGMTNLSDEQFRAVADAPRWEDHPGMCAQCGERRLRKSLSAPIPGEAWCEHIRCRACGCVVFNVKYRRGEDGQYRPARDDQ